MLRGCLAVGIGLLLTLPASAAAPLLQDQWVVVHAPEYRPALGPLIDHRREQGMRVVAIDASATPALLSHVREVCRRHHGRSSILLVGAPHLRGTISRMKGEPTDAAYGCLDDTRLPRVAVGRFPARTVEEVRAMVAKTLALERDAAPGAWRHRLTVLAGIPAYNPVVDRLVEGIAFARFDRLHPAWTGRAIYTGPQSRFALPDRQIRSQAIDYLREGQAVILYLGHSNAEGLYAGPTAAFLHRDDWAKLTIDAGGSVFVTFGCNGCQLAGPDGEGYGVAAMRNPRGPAAVLGSHGICFAAMVQLGADALFQRAFEAGGSARLGDCWLATLEGVARGRIDFLSYKMLDAVDGDPRIDQATQRQEHLEMFVLLGDPALRLPRVVDDLDVRAEPTITAGKSLLVEGTLPERLRGAAVRVTLERSPGSVPDDLEPVPVGLGRDKALLANHKRANQFAVAEATAAVRGDGFTARLEVPAEVPWPRLTLRVYAATRRAEGMHVRRLEVAGP